jgi:hypothetical protein
MYSDNGELELAACPPDAVLDQVGLEAVEERLSERAVVGVARSDRGEHLVVGERLRVVDARQLAQTQPRSTTRENGFTEPVALPSTASTDLPSAGLAAFSVQPIEAASTYSRSVLGAPAH